MRRLVWLVLLMVVPSAFPPVSSFHDGCWFGSANPATYIQWDLRDLGMGIYYTEERDTGLPPFPPLTGYLFANGTWAYEETNGFPGLQRGGSNGHLPLFVGEDYMNDMFSCEHAPDRLVLAVFGPPTVSPACNDGLDNDGDLATDYPLDGGCTSLDDDSEADSACNIAPAIALCLTPGPVVLEENVSLVQFVPTTPHTVVGYVDAYNFTAGGAVLTLPCLTLGVDANSVNPCGLLGGTFSRRVFGLVQTFQEQSIAFQQPLATVRVCEAQLTALVLGFGVSSAPAYAPC